MFIFIIYLSFSLIRIELMAMEARQANFEILKGLKLSNSYKTIPNSQDLKCVYHCLDDSACLSANFNNDKQICELNSQSPKDELSIIIEAQNWKLLYPINESTWKLVFRATAGIGVKTYSAFTGSMSLPTPEDACKLTHNLSCTTHYRDPIIDQWETQDIKQVKFEMYKDNKMVVSVIFNNTYGGNNTHWFNRKQLVSSTYTDLLTEPVNYFSIEGADYVNRRFYINSNWGGCAADAGWITVFDDDTLPGSTCPYEQHLQYPYFGYSKNNLKGNWIDKQSADVFCIFIKKS